MKKIDVATILIAFSIVFLVSFGILTPFKPFINTIAETEQPSNNLKLLDISDNIDVYSNEELFALGFQGNGTQIDPVVIENLIIDNGVYGSFIRMENISLNVIIQNCYLVSGGMFIQINNCHNSNFTISGNNIANGIDSINIQDCFNVSITNNVLPKCQRGIIVKYVEICNISNNKIDFSSSDSVWIESVNLVLVSNNTVAFEHGGIHVRTSFNVTITNNICNRLPSDISPFGIFIDADHLYMSGNNVTNTGYSFHNLYSYGCLTFKVSNNYVNGKLLGAFLNLENESFTDPIYGQLIFANSTNITIENQDFINVQTGIEMIDCTDFKISENIFSKIEMYCCHIVFCENLSISSNVFIDSYFGIAGSDDDDLLIANNYFQSNYRSVRTYREPGKRTVVDSNIFVGSGYDIDFSSIESIDYIEITNNTVNGKILSFYRHESDLLLTGDNHGQIILADCSHITIRNINIASTYGAIQSYFSNDVIIEQSIFNYFNHTIIVSNSQNFLLKGCTFNLTYMAIDTFKCSNITMQDVNITDGIGAGISCSYGYDITIQRTNIYRCRIGISFMNTDNSKIIYNTIKDCEIDCVRLDRYSENNKIYQNNFLNNYWGFSTSRNSQAYDDGVGNLWYDDVNQLGNFWSDFDTAYNYYSIDGSAGSRDLFPSDVLIQDTLETSETSETSEMCINLVAIPFLGVFSYLYLRRKNKEKRV